MPQPNPTPRRRCPFPECPSHARPGSPGVVRHGFMKSRHGARLRLLCRACGRTFCNRRGTAYYRLQYPRRTFDQFAALLTEGVSSASLARALHVAPGTISRWLARAGQHAGAFSEEHDCVPEPLELQFDELCAGPINKGFPWVFNGIEVWSRYWVAGHVGKRNRSSTRRFVLRSRQTCGELRAPVLIVSDPFPYYLQEIRRTFGATCVYVHLHTRYRQDCVLRSSHELVLGAQWKLDYLRSRSEDSQRLNKAYVERLNLFLRRSCTYLHRRTSGRVRNPQRLASAVELIRCGYNFIKPHQSLRFGRVTRTPAMQAEIFTRALSWREVFAWPLKRASPVAGLEFVKGSSHSSRQSPRAATPVMGGSMVIGAGTAQVPNGEGYWKVVNTVTATLLPSSRPAPVRSCPLLSTPPAVALSGPVRS